MSAIKPKKDKKTKAKDTKIKKTKIEIKTSGDFKNDPEGAMDALDKSGFLVFMVTEKWYRDSRAQKEWRFAKDMDKPMIYIIDESGRRRFNRRMFTPNLVATINHYGDMEVTGKYLQAFIAAYQDNLK
jgi:hypothetical protein